MGEIYFDVDGFGLSYGEMKVGVGGERLMLSSWFSKCSRNSNCVSERLPFSSVENVSLLLSIGVGVLFVD